MNLLTLLFFITVIYGLCHPEKMPKDPKPFP